MDEGRGARGNCQRIAESGQVMGGGGRRPRDTPLSTRIPFRE